MRLWQDSLFVEGTKSVWGWLARVGRHSLIGRGVIGATGALGRYTSDSLVFTTRGIRPLPLDAPELPLTARVFGWPYVQLRRLLADGGTGRAIGRLGSWAQSSSFRSGAWIRLVGATLVGTACGCAVRGQVASPIVVALLGLILLLGGPWLVGMSGDSWVFRRAWVSDISRPRTVRQRRDEGQNLGLIVVGSSLCLILGVIAGLVDDLGPVWLTAAAAVAVLAVVVVWRPEATLLVAAAFPWVDVMLRSELGKWGGAWDEGLLLISMVLLIAGVLVTGRLRLRTVPISLPVLFVLVAAVASVVIRGVPGDVGLYGTRVLLEPLLFYFMGFLLCSTPNWVKGTVTVFLMSTSALALHGLYQYVTRVPTPTTWVDSSETSIVTRAFSVIGNPNGLGSVLVIGILVALSLFLSSGLRRSTRFSLASAVVVQTGGLLVTFSRGAWIGLACGVVALLLVGYRRYLLPVLLLGLAGIVASPSMFVDRFLLVFSENYLSKAAVDGRLYRWALALDQISVHPWFGIGLGTFGGSSAAQYGYWSAWVDNFYLQIGAEGGLLLLAAFAWLMLRVSKGLVKGARVGEHAFQRALAAGVFGAFVAVAVANVFASVFETLAVGVGLWLLAGLATSAAISWTPLSRE